MKKKLKIVVWFSLIALVGIQFTPTNRNQSQTLLITDFSTVYDIPNNISVLLKTSCYDCHSNTTVYPWYSSIQPGAWLMENHITDGKEELNFSEFGSYSNRRKKNKLKSIASQIKKNEMPLPSYLLMHGNARLSDNDKDMIVFWLNGLMN